MRSFAKWGWVTVPAILVVVGASVYCNGGNAKSAVGSGKPVVIFEAEPAGKRGWLEIGWRDPIPLDHRVEKIVRVVAEDLSAGSGASQYSIEMDRNDEWWCGGIKVYLSDGEEIDTKMILFTEKPKAHTVTASLNNYACCQW